MAWRCLAPRAAGDAARKPWVAAVPVAWASRRVRREALPMSHIACGSPPARRIAQAISMGHYQRSLVLEEKDMLTFDRIALTLLA